MKEETKSLWSSQACLCQEALYPLPWTVLIIGVPKHKEREWKAEKQLKEYSLKLHENYKPSDPIVQKQLNKVKAQKIKENYTRAHSI